MVSKLWLIHVFPDIDDCVKKPCKHGACQDELNDFSCKCESGWDGKTCEIGMIYLLTVKKESYSGIVVVGKNLILHDSKKYSALNYAILIVMIIYFSRHWWLRKKTL